MRDRSPFYNGVMLWVILVVIQGCSMTRWDPQLHEPNEISGLENEQTLKVHLASGDVVLLTEWMEDVHDRVLRGNGTRYDVTRAEVESGAVQLPVDEIILAETYVKDRRTLVGLTLFSVYASGMTFVTAACAADPKACFGSCPTFYTDNSENARPVAEGFSGSVARVLEKRDIDALYHADASGNRFEITMRNEALETHAVRHVRLMVVPRPEKGRVFSTESGVFYPAVEISSPDSCLDSDGNCLSSVTEMDGTARYSPADSTNLATREEIVLEFTNLRGEKPGLVIGARHSFVSTHIYYQMLAWLGEDATSMLVMLERGKFTDMPPLFDTLKEMGEIRISVQDSSGNWTAAGIYSEAGPIALDLQVIPLQDISFAGTDTLKVRLDLVRGFWRLDYLALANLGSPVEPIELEPVSVYSGDLVDERAGEALLNPDRYLFTYPGDQYRMLFELPATSGPLELFLDSGGYYYEWMRNEWLEEYDPVQAFQLLYMPEMQLREMAKTFKKAEPVMESLFWDSRFGRVEP